MNRERWRRNFLIKRSAAKAALPGPLRLHPGGNHQAVERADEAVDVADVRFLFQCDLRNAHLLQQRRFIHRERRVRIQFAVKIAGGTEEPIAEFFFQPDGVGSLEICGAFVHALRHRAEADIGVAGVQTVKLAAKTFFNRDALDFIIQIKFDDLDAFVDAPRWPGQCCARTAGRCPPRPIPWWLRCPACNHIRSPAPFAANPAM